MGGAVSGESVWRRSRIVVPIGSPAAGADWSLVVPAGHLYRLRSLYATLTTSATVATRVVNLAFGDGVRTFLTAAASASQTAGLVRQYAWYLTAGAYAFGSRIVTPLPELTLGTAWSVGSATDAIDAGDAWSAIFALVDDLTARAGALDLYGYPDMTVEVVSPPPG